MEGPFYSILFGICCLICIGSADNSTIPVSFPPGGLATKIESCEFGSGMLVCTLDRFILALNSALFTPDQRSVDIKNSENPDLSAYSPAQRAYLHAHYCRIAHHMANSISDGDMTINGVHHCKSAAVFSDDEWANLLKGIDAQPARVWSTIGVLAGAVMSCYTTWTTFVQLRRSISGKLPVGDAPSTLNWCMLKSIVVTILQVFLLGGYAIARFDTNETRRYDPVNGPSDWTVFQQFGSGMAMAGGIGGLCALASELASYVWKTTRGPTS